jgi:hypothetical protein
MSWLVESRSQNQELSLKLFLIMKDHAEQISEEFDLQDIAQGLAAVCFSLWRAVFLSDITDRLEDHITNAHMFLGNLILHNMVAYQQDRNARDWSFIYYVNNARYRLEAMSKQHEDIMPKALVAEMEWSSAKDFWSCCHAAAVVAVRSLEVRLKKAAPK